VPDVPKVPHPARFHRPPASRNSITAGYVSSASLSKGILLHPLPLFRTYVNHRERCVSELKMLLYASCEITHSEVIGNLVEVKEITAAMQDKDLSHRTAEQ
jgi:hypothetical protein